MDGNNNFTLSEDINGPLLAAVFGIEMVAGLITNSFVLILTACHFKTWKQPSTIFLTNMLLNYLIIVIFVMPFGIITAASGEWIFGNTYNQKMKVCQFTAFMFWYCATVITEGLVLLSFDRFFYIVKSFEYERHMTRKKAAIMVAISWVLAAILSSPPLFGFSKFAFAFSYGICVPEWEGQPLFVAYALAIFLTLIGSIVVTSAWTFCYTQHYLKNESQRLQSVSPNDNESKNNLYFSRSGRLIGLFGMIMLVYILCYAPAIITSIIELITVVPLQMYTTIFVLFLLQTTLSPLVQSVFRQDIRQSTLAFLVWCHKKFCSKEYTRVSSTAK